MKPNTIQLHIDGMSCTSCAKSVQKQLMAVRDVKKADVNFATASVLVKFEDGKVNVDAALQAIRDAGYEGQLSGERERLSREERRLKEENASFLRFIFAAALTLPFTFQMIGMVLGYGEFLSPWMQLALASGVQFGVGGRFYTSSFHALKAKAANMDVLIAMGTTAAYGFSLFVLLLGLEESLYFESSATIITLILLGRWLETRSKGKASKAIEKLLHLQPRKVMVKRDGDFVEVPLRSVQVGDHFLVREGENIAVDGRVVEGDAAVHEAMLTGESQGVPKVVGSQVFAGTTNVKGDLVVQAEKVGSDTVLGSIISIVEKAQRSKAPIQNLADQVSEIFVPTVAVISVLTFVLWLVVGTFHDAIINAVSVLVIACPCALGLATPIVMVVATGKGAEQGILFREAQAIQNAEKIDTILFDKTGTLTKGEPTVTSIIAFGDRSEDEVLSIAASIEKRSNHPLALAILAAAKVKDIAFIEPKRVETLSGKGMRGVVKGVEYFIGSLTLAEQKGVDIDSEALSLVSQSLGSLIVLWSGTEAVGLIAVEDEIREGLKEVVENLNRLKIHSLVVSGDRKRVVQEVSRRAGIETFYAEILPEVKSQTIENLKRKGHTVGMVGDGINDAPALAVADVGFAIGAGSDIAIESSDVTLIHNALEKVVSAINLSRKTMLKVRQNLFLAFIFNILAIPLAAFGALTPILAAAAMSMSSLLVVTNALLLGKKKLEF